MRKIEISEELWEFLRGHGELWGETPDEVLRRLLRFDSRAVEPARGTIQAVETQRDSAPSAKERARRNRLRYVESLRSEGIGLAHIERIFFKSRTGKRVAIPSATARPRFPGKWFLGMAEKELVETDILILLCVTEEGGFLDFILPPSVVSDITPHLSRERDRDKRNKQVKFNIAQGGENRYYLSLPGRDQFSITQYLHATGSLVQSRD